MLLGTPNGKNGVCLGKNPATSFPNLPLELPPDTHMSPRKFEKPQRTRLSKQRPFQDVFNTISSMGTPIYEKPRDLYTAAIHF